MQVKRRKKNWAMEDKTSEISMIINKKDVAKKNKSEKRK